MDISYKILGMVYSRGLPRSIVFWFALMIYRSLIQILDGYLDTGIIYWVIWGTKLLNAYLLRTLPDKKQVTELM